jgi:hypothetical protein
MQGLNYIKHKNIDFVKWDKLILNSPIPLVFAQSFYLNATSPGWDALILNDYESVLPVTVKKKLGIIYLPQPSFTSQLGVFGNTKPEIVFEFYTYLKKTFKLIEYEFNYSNKFDNTNVKPKKTFIIDYKNEINYNQNTIRNIKKAKALNYQVQFINPNDSECLVKVYINPFLKSISIKNNQLKVFSKIINQAIKFNALDCLVTKDQKNKIVAIAYFIYNTNYVLYLKGTTIDKNENSGSMHLLLDFAIKHYSKTHKYFDFGGGSLNIGLANFYKGLGGSELNYQYVKVNNLPKIINMLKKN